jgi:UDP-N-acetylglucosamine 1-carboxyvinyltransferase
MESLLVRGGNKLNGTIDISGAKNAALPIMTAAILSDKPLILDNIPTGLTDIATMTELLSNLGIKCEVEKNTVTILADNVTNLIAPYDIVCKMRASIWVLGPLLTRFGKAKVSFPGGCTLGARQVDLHLSGLEAMGATIEIDGGYIIAEAPSSGLKATDFSFNKISVGATINLIMAAVLAKGTSIFSNCAKEPEITDLCNCLVGMGAKITGIGTDKVHVEGISSLNAHRYRIIPDRIEAGTYMMMGAITGGEILLRNVHYEIVHNTALKLAEAGIIVEDTEKGVLIHSNDGITAADISTMPFPGFATDLQAQYMALMCVANGTSVITENLFENRFMHVPELCRMGANINVTGHNNAIVRGTKQLIGAEVMASDLRASVSLVMAGLVAEGETKIRRIYHLDRGYENLEEKLRACGADIERLKEDSV